MVTGMALNPDLLTPRSQSFFPDPISNIEHPLHAIHHTGGAGDGPVPKLHLNVPPASLRCCEPQNREARGSTALGMNRGTVQKGRAKGPSAS